jgi:hypothetical protein
MIQRCYNPNIRCYNERRASGIEVEHVWSHLNPDGLANFAKWVEEKLAEKPEIRDTDYRITRNDRKKNYGPDNCRLATPQEVCQNRFTSVLTADLVIKMRQYKRQNPKATLRTMELMFDQTAVNISRALLGVTWSSVNNIEPPLPKRGTVKEEELA